MKITQTNSALMKKCPLWGMFETGIIQLKSIDKNIT